MHLAVLGRLAVDAPDGTFRGERRSGTPNLAASGHCCFPSRGTSGEWLRRPKAPGLPGPPFQQGWAAHQRASLSFPGLSQTSSLPGAPGSLPLPQSAFVPKDGVPTAAGKLLLRIPAPADFFPHLNSRGVRVCIVLLLIKHVPQPVTTAVLLHRAISPLLAMLGLSSLGLVFQARQLAAGRTVRCLALIRHWSPIPASAPTRSCS